MRKPYSAFLILALLLIVISGCNNPPQSNMEVKENDIKPVIKQSPAIYSNIQYGFNFSLPDSWRNFSIVSDTWEGSAPGGQIEGAITESGPLLSIRHPQWTSQNQRQDIPILVFTHDQWNSLQQGKFHIGATPVGPSELGRNISYVFALPARYNYAFQQGYEEVENILKGSPLQNSRTEEVDLDGNGTIDKISFDCKVGGSEFTLTVNDVSIKGSGDNLDGHCTVVDIDTSDNTYEIAIPESGPSDDYKTAFYYFDGSSITKMGKVQGAGTVRIDGSGTVTAKTRGTILQTWFYDDPYELSTTHLLQRVPQDLYEMNSRVKVKRLLALQKSRSSSEIVMTLQPGEEVTILSSDDQKWCLVENNEGVRGWFAVNGFDQIRGSNLSATEFFEGLSNAD